MLPRAMCMHFRGKSSFSSLYTIFVLLWFEDDDVVFLMIRALACQRCLFSLESMKDLCHELENLPRWLSAWYDRAVMKDVSTPKRQRQQPRSWHLVRYAYHEAGHAIVGHVIGRCIAELSIVREHGYRGYCAFDAFAEDMHSLPQWRDGSKNPECITILYAGTIAQKVLCEQRGWNYEHWRRIDKADFDAIYLWAIEMFPSRDDDEKRLTIQRTCKLQAQDVLTHHWCAVEALAAQLQEKGWLSGGEAHGIIRQALGENGAEWRLTEGRLLSRAPFLY